MHPQPDSTLTSFSLPAVLGLVFQAQPNQNRFPLWLIIVIVVIVLLIGWFWWSRRRQANAVIAAMPPALPQTEKLAPIAPTPATPTGEAIPEPPVAAEPANPDDLKRIEGIGPKIANLLQGAGFTTFNQLAAADVSELRAILNAAGLAGLADPTSWPEQAQLAAAGQWAELETLQATLKGGRPVN
jgi:predicted flap endonuclease-1-like 5' DNA nuclease